MSNKTSKFDQALKELVDSFSSVHSELVDKFEDDEDGYQHALLETVENAIEGALEDSDVDAGFLAGFLTTCSEALENLDPEAFSEAEEGDEGYAIDDVDYDDDDDDLDEDDLDDTDDDE